MSEKYYDEVIAPKLMELMKLAEADGTAFLATVEYAPGQTGSSIHLPKDCCVAMRLNHLMAMCNGNFDKFCMALMRSPEFTKGHNSIFLHKIGIEP